MIRNTPNARTTGNILRGFAAPNKEKRDSGRSGEDPRAPVACMGASPRSPNPVQPMAPFAIQFDEHPSEADLAFLFSSIRQFNRATGGHEPPRPVASWLRDDAGRIVGGAGG